MDKNAIKKYAIWARCELIERVSQRAMIYGITEKDVGDPKAESVNGHLLSQAEMHQRQALIRNIKEKGYEQVMEEVAYTWFNRFAALRFMEVNGYLPSHIRVFTNDTGEFKPQILTEAIHLELDGLDMNKVYELESANKSEELFKYLLIVQCNALNSILPGMFQKINDYTELLLPDYLLREGSVIEQMIALIPEGDWTDQVQIIGWLYQYYNTEPKDKVFADLKKNIKISKENIPAATQLFTPDWIVHYMVENSLGRLWLEGHPNDSLKSEWKYYLDEAEQEPDVQVQLAEIRKEYAALKPEEIRVIDPCQGSGHILCVLFDVLVRIYEDYGYTAREAAGKIVENNLWGLDIDDRASQLAYFSVMMKARQYDRRFFTRGIQPNVYAFEESNGISGASLHDMGINLTHEEYEKAVEQVMILIEEFHDAKEYGSIINVSNADWELLRRFAVPLWKSEGGQMSLNIHDEDEAALRLQTLITLGRVMSQKYHVVVTNPPYMGMSGADGKLSEYVKEYYPDSKSDLFAVFIAKCLDYTKHYSAMITQHSWMFLSSFENLREKILKKAIVNMAHLGARAFSDIGGEVVQTTSFVLNKNYIKNYKGTYCRLIEPNSENDKKNMFLSGENRYTATQENFSKIPGSPVAYWVSEKIINSYDNGKLLGEIGRASEGVKTGDNNRFLRLWFEIADVKFSFAKNQKTKWIPHLKGGEFRKWYGNLEYAINWENDGYEIKNSANSGLQGKDMYFKPVLCWSKITSKGTSLRYVPENCLFDSGSPAYYSPEYLYYVLAFVNTLGTEILNAINPTLNCQVGDIKGLPLLIDNNKKTTVNELVQENIDISKADWDSFETSWDFKRHPLV